MGVGEIFLRGRGVLSPIKFALWEGHERGRARNKEMKRERKRKEHTYTSWRFEEKEGDCRRSWPRNVYLRHLGYLQEGTNLANITIPTYPILSLYLNAPLILIRSSNCIGVREKLKRITLQLHGNARKWHVVYRIKWIFCDKRDLNWISSAKTLVVLSMLLSIFTFLQLENFVNRVHNVSHSSRQSNKCLLKCITNFPARWTKNSRI